MIIIDGKCPEMRPYAEKLGQSIGWPIVSAPVMDTPQEYAEWATGENKIVLGYHLSHGKTGNDWLNLSVQLIESIDIHYCIVQNLMQWIVDRPFLRLTDKCRAGSTILSTTGDAMAITPHGYTWQQQVKRMTISPVWESVYDSERAGIRRLYGR